MNDRESGWDFFHHINNHCTSCFFFVHMLELTLYIDGGVAKLTTPFGCNDMLYISDPLAIAHVCRKVRPPPHHQTYFVVDTTLLERR
jgi:hypothetical protein